VAVTERPTARRLDDLLFAKGSGRVNNCAKRLLIEELTPLLRDNPDWTVVLVGHRDEQEPANLDRVRAQNAAAVISAGTGICPSLELNRVKIDTVGTNQSSTPRPAFCGASTGIKERSGQGVTETDNRAQFRRVEVWVVPAGAEMPEGLRNAKDAPVEVIKKLGCPR
jgi:outer membrane protein OmpA-like peptidoglycan-associated protein